MRYEPMRNGRLFVLGLFTAFAVAGVFLVVALAAGAEQAPPPAFVVLWLGALAWNAYWWLLRIALSITLVDDTLHWEAGLSSGTTSLHELVEVRPMRWATNVEVFVRRDGRPILVFVTKGLGELLAEISRSRPELPVRLGWQGRLAERLPGRSRIDRRT